MGRSLFALTVLLIFLISDFNITMAYEREIKNLSSIMSENIAKAGRKTIAVVDFTDLQGNVTELGRFVAEEFSVALAGADKGFEVIDRTHLKTILKEHKLAVTDIIDPSTARKLGQIAGVQALITGTITPFGDSVRLSVKILDTASAKVIGASSGDIAKTKAIEELLAKGIENEARTDPEGPAPTLRSKPKALAKVEMNDFSFEARECKRSGQKIFCTIAITNTAEKEKKDIGVGGAGGTVCDTASFLYDNFGNQYLADEVRFGAETNRRGVRQDIPTGLPVLAILTFKDVSSDAQLASLRVGMTDRCNTFFPMLRNIPLLK